MQSNRPPNKGQRPKFIDMKVLIIALSVAVVIGFWNLFSSNAYTDDKSSPSMVVTLPPQQPAVAADNLPPLPTLIPLVDVTVPQINLVSKTSNQPQTNNPPAVQPQPSGQLRVVGVPTQVIVQKQNPVFGAVNSAPSADSSSSSGGGGGGKSSKSTTKSSKKK